MIPLLITGGAEKERLEKASRFLHGIRNTGYPAKRDPAPRDGIRKKEKKKNLSHVTYKQSLISGEIHISHITSNPDFTLLDSPSSIGIDKVRDLQKKLFLKPFGKGPKVAIINNAQNLTIQAQNAFLKTLEEPPKNSQIILTTPTPESLLPTIISRCQVIGLPHKSQISLSKKELTNHFNLLILILNSPIGERLQKVENLSLFKDRQKALEWVDIQTMVVRETLLDHLTSQPSSHSSASRLPSSPKPPKPFSHLTIKQLLLILQSLLKTKKYLQANVNIRLALDNFLIGLPHLKSKMS